MFLQIHNFPDTNYFAIDTSDLTNRGSGYNFTKGDIAIITI